MSNPEFKFTKLKFRTCCHCSNSIDMTLKIITLNMSNSNNVWTQLCSVWMNVLNVLKKAGKATS